MTPLSVRATIGALGTALLVGAAVGAYASHRWDTRQSVAVQIAHAGTQRAMHRVVRVDTVYQRSRDTLTRWLTRYRTARVTDTVTHDSIVYVRRDVADSTVHACRLVLSTCALAVAARDSVIAAQRVEIRAVQAARPSVLHRIAVDAAWLGAGYVLGRSGVGAGLRVPLPGLRP